jgi:hypothetical protein
MASVTINFNVTATFPCSKKAAKAYNDSGEEEALQKIAERAEAFIQRIPGAKSVDVDHSVEETDDE